MNDHQIISVKDVYSLPLATLVSQANVIHTREFPDSLVQASSLLSIKTGGCPENCSYCPQSAHYKTGVAKTAMLQFDEVMSAARTAKKNGATRFCMGAAWKEVQDDKNFQNVLEFIRGVKTLDLETCCTLGMLKEHQARLLRQAGLDFYNHNIDTSSEFYSQVIQTRTYQQRLDTIHSVRKAGIAVCTGGILGLGESEKDRILFIAELVHLTPQPESITINVLVPIAGTPLEFAKPIESFELVRVIASLRILAPRSMIRLSAGRVTMSDETQFLCFLSGANSIFLGDKLLTSKNPEASQDLNLLNKCGLKLQDDSVRKN